MLGSFVYVCSLWAFLSLDNLELDVIAFLKTLITFRGDRAVVHKNIGPFVAPNESVAFRVVKPFHRTFQTFHLRPLGHVLFRTEAVPYIGCNFDARGWGCQGRESLRTGLLCGFGTDSALVQPKNGSYSLSVTNDAPQN